MKKQKINPRTGIIGVGVPRPQRPPPSIRSLPAHYSSIPASHPVTLDTEHLISVAKEIGKAIVGELKKGIQVTGVVSEAHRAPYRPSLTREVTESAITGIQIDESLIDVGIGKMDELKKGEGSANLTKADTKEDVNFQRSKNKLKALKRG